MDIVSTRLEFQCAGEILGVTLKFNDGRKFILCTYITIGLVHLVLIIIMNLRVLYSLVS